MPLNKLPLQKEQSIALAGDDTGAGVLYFFIFGTEVYVADTPEQILDALAQEGIRPQVDRTAISHLLHYSVVPVPSTCLTGLHVLSMGDRASLIATDSGIELSFVNDVPYLEQRSSGRSAPDTHRLLECLTHAVQEVGRGDSIALLMSAGKDSVSLAVALAEAGLRDSVCITYRSQLEKEPESAIAAGFCSRLGLKHRVVQCPMDQNVLRAELDNWFKTMPLPVVDPASLAVLLCAHEERRPVLMDGMGNDVYLGYVLKPLSAWRQNLSRATDRMPRLRAALCAMTETGHRLFAPRPVLCFPMDNFHPRKTALFFPDVVDTLAFWTEEALHYHHLGNMDLERVISRHLDEQVMMLKTRAAAAYIGARPVFPWCDARVIKYLFDLPAAARYNLESGLNKILIRQMLRERLEYDDALIGKRGFANDGPILLNLLRDYILEHVSACRLWNRSAVDLARRYLDSAAVRPRLQRQLFTLLVVSAWFNLSRYARA